MCTIYPEECAQAVEACVDKLDIRKTPIVLPFADPYLNENKKTRKKVKGLQGEVDKHKEKIRNNPDSRDVPHWEGEIDAWEERIKRLKKRLPNGR